MPYKYPFWGPLPQYNPSYIAIKHGISRREARAIIELAAGSRSRATYLAAAMAQMPSPVNGCSDTRIEAFRARLKAHQI